MNRKEFFLSLFYCFSCALLISTAHASGNAVEEEIERLVREAYRDVLLREPDRAGLTHYMLLISEGERIENVRSILQSSPEGRLIEQKRKRWRSVFAGFTVAALLLLAGTVWAFARAFQRHKPFLPWFAPRLLLSLVSVLLASCLLELAMRIAIIRIDARRASFVLDNSGNPALSDDLRLVDILQKTSNPVLYYEFKPGTQFHWLDKQVTINEHGFRGEDRSFHKPQGVFRIVGIGDSVLWGWGVSDSETYLALLEEILNSRPGLQQVETINFGVPGYNTVMEVESLRAKGLAYNPDLVILNYVANDFDLPPFFHPPRDVAVLNRSFLLETIHEYIDSIRQAAFGRRVVYKPVNVHEEFSHLIGWAPFEKAIHDLAELSKEYGFRVLVIALEGPMPSNVERLFDSLRIPYFYPFDRYSQEYAMGRDIHSYLSSPLYLSNHDPHPSSFGHEFAAKQLAEYLKSDSLEIKSQVSQ